MCDQVDSPCAVQLASWVRKLQNYEKEKLQITVILHVERRRLAQMDHDNDDAEAGCTHSAACHILTNSEDSFAAAVQVCFQTVTLILGQAEIT